MARGTDWNADGERRTTDGNWRLRVPCARRHAVRAIHNSPSFAMEHRKPPNAAKSSSTAAPVWHPHQLPEPSVSSNMSYNTPNSNLIKEFVSFKRPHIHISRLHGKVPPNLQKVVKQRSVPALRSTLRVVPVYKFGIPLKRPTAAVRRSKAPATKKSIAPAASKRFKFPLKPNGERSPEL